MPSPSRRERAHQRVLRARVRAQPGAQPDPAIAHGDQDCAGSLGRHQRGRQIEDVSWRAGICTSSRSSTSSSSMRRAAQLSAVRAQSARGTARFRWRRHDYLVTQMGGIHRRVATTLLTSHPIADAPTPRLTLRGSTASSRCSSSWSRAAAPGSGRRAAAALRLRPDDRRSRNLVKGRPFDGGADCPMLADFRAKIAATNGQRASRPRS